MRGGDAVPKFRGRELACGAPSDPLPGLSVFPSTARLQEL